MYFVVEKCIDGIQFFNLVSFGVLFNRILKFVYWCVIVYSIEKEFYEV